MAIPISFPADDIKACNQAFGGMGRVEKGHAMVRLENCRYSPVVVIIVIIMVVKQPRRKEIAQLEGASEERFSVSGWKKDGDFPRGQRTASRYKTELPISRVIGLAWPFRETQLLSAFFHGFYECSRGDIECAHYHYYGGGGEGRDDSAALIPGK